MFELFFNTKKGLFLFKLKIKENKEDLQNLEEYKRINFRMYERFVKGIFIGIGVGSWFLTEVFIYDYLVSLEFSKYEIILSFLLILGAFLFVFFMIASLNIRYHKRREKSILDFVRSQTK